MSIERTFRVSKAAILAACDIAEEANNKALKEDRRKMVSDLMQPHWWRKGKSQAEAEKIALLEIPDGSKSDLLGWVLWPVCNWRDICRACCELELMMSMDEAAWVGHFMPKE